jgi:protease-4
LAKWVQQQYPGGAELVANYGQPSRPSVELSNPFAVLQMILNPRPVPQSNQPAVATIYATGTIVDDLPDGSGFEDQLVTPSSIRSALDKALNDQRVKAIVLRVDSPGGSASASDLIWHALRAADQRKPVTVSMGGTAASGGYYIASAGRSITADPATITGSIGVVGGKIVLGQLLDRIGISVQHFDRGQHAAMLGATRPFTEQERAYVRAQMEQVYNQFTDRVKEARGGKIADVAAVAQGRLFTGPAAVKAGLIDGVGTLNDTILAAAKGAGIQNDYQIIVYPQPKTLEDLLRGGMATQSPLPAEWGAMLKVMPAAYRGAVFQAFGLVQSLQHEHVLLAMPAAIVEGE